jgi:hypothetical protein
MARSPEDNGQATEVGVLRQHCAQFRRGEGQKDFVFLPGQTAIACPNDRRAASSQTIDN